MFHCLKEFVWRASIKSRHQISPLPFFIKTSLRVKRLEKLPKILSSSLKFTLLHLESVDCLLYFLKIRFFNYPYIAKNTHAKYSLLCEKLD